MKKANIADSKKVVEICTQYAQKGMFNIFITVFLGALAFAFYESYFFIGYLIGIALFGLFQALFMANAGGAWDNAKKVVEVELQRKRHAAARCVRRRRHRRRSIQRHVERRDEEPRHQVHHALPVSCAVQLAERLEKELGDQGGEIRHIISAVLFVITLFFVYRSFYGMRIESGSAPKAEAPKEPQEKADTKKDEEAAEPAE